MTFSNKSDGLDIIHAADINALQNAVTAVTPQQAGGVVARKVDGTLVERPGPHVDVRDYDVDPTGNNDSADAINAAIADAAANTGFMTYLGGKGAVYSISKPLLIPSSGWLSGASAAGLAGGTTINFVGTSLTDNAIQPSAPGRSGFRVEHLHLVDQRTDPARTGTGISADNVFNGTYIADCNVQNFYDNYLVGSLTAGGGDCIMMDRCWSVSALHYGYNVTHPANTTVLRALYGDSLTGSTQQALISVANATRDNPVIIQGVKHEVGNSSDTLLIDQNVSVVATGVTMRGPGPGRDVVRISSGFGANVILMAISGRNTALGDTATVPVNLINVVSLGLTIPTSTISFVPFWLGGQEQLMLGNAVIEHIAQSQGPEGFVTAPVGSLGLHPTSAKFFFKQTGAGNTGWRQVPVFDPAAPTVAAGTGAGTSPTVSVSGNARGGTITVTTGTAPAASATVCIVTYANALPAAGVVLLSPVEPNAAALTGTAMVYVDNTQNTTDHFALKVGSIALIEGTTYKWSYQAIG